MAKIQWKSRKTAGVLVALFILYLSIRLRDYEHKAFIFLPKVKPNEAWDFVADFSNMKYLNPTLERFTIIDESGNYDHWKYSAEYWEHLSSWPYLKNYAIGIFNVKTINDSYVIDSVHRTCFLFGLYCVESSSEFRFTKNHTSDGTICEEMIIYQCPALLSSICKKEVVYQRNAIMSNLRKHFIKKSTSTIIKH